MLETNNVAKYSDIKAETLEKILLGNDVANLNSKEKVMYVQQLSTSLGLNYLARPFQIIKFEGKEMLYATKDCTEQLRKVNNISIQIVSRDYQDDLLIVTAEAKTPDGRIDQATGVVPLTKEDGVWETSQSGKRYFKGNGNFIPLRGAERANAVMKAETKAKRRVTLSICGLGILDESELDTMQGHQFVPIKEVPAQDNSQEELLLEHIQMAPTLEALQAEFKKAQEYAKSKNDNVLYTTFFNATKSRKQFLEKHVIDVETQQFVNELGEPDEIV